MRMWIYDQMFTFLNTGRYAFYNILLLSRRRHCRGLIRYGILYDIMSPDDDNATALAEFALFECSCYIHVKNLSDFCLIS